MNKPFSQACENNKQPILNVLTTVFNNSQHVLEIGSGTGQHAVFFAKHLPHLTWQTSDLAINHQGINAWLNESTLTNVLPPIAVDLNDTWPISTLSKSNAKSQSQSHKSQQQQLLPFDGLYTANTLHIISWPLVIKFFEGIAEIMGSQARICIYGPFNYQGEFTSPSNANFDLWLKDRDSQSGIRDIEAILALADAAGLDFIADHGMPANNRLLVFSKR
ncbi:DUF938 domain-containing protein [Colwellia piezophila]|uniref:DUF938 domain-containing protein n=1 Tax=Colwellia piezophila TaxID=211668 RepID=UPI000360B791|nr:DUF938 domain-containing protein [Colwellia piezophila]